MRKRVDRQIDSLARTNLSDARRLSDFVGAVPGLSTATYLERLRNEWDR